MNMRRWPTLGEPSPPVHNSQAGVNDDRVGFDGEAKDPGVFGRISEDDLLPLCVLLWEQTDFWDAVILR